MAEGKRKAATRLSVDERVRQFREAVRAKYKHRCAACGLTNAAQKSINGRALSIHRVKPGSARFLATTKTPAMCPAPPPFATCNKF